MFTVKYIAYATLEFCCISVLWKLVSIHVYNTYDLELKEQVVHCLRLLLLIHMLTKCQYKEFDSLTQCECVMVIYICLCIYILANILNVCVYVWYLRNISIYYMCHAIYMCVYICVLVCICLYPNCTYMCICECTKELYV